MKYLRLYYKWMETGTMPDRCSYDIRGIPYYGGLCGIFLHDPLFQRMIPQNVKSWEYWGYGKVKGMLRRDEKTDFTPLRQTIVLFLAAMNNEF